MLCGRLLPLLVAVCVASVLLFQALFRLPEGPARFPVPAWRGSKVPAAVGQVDAAFRAEWQRRGLQPARRADELIIARRISLGLTGTVPSLEEIRRLEAIDAVARTPTWVEYVLRDPRASDYLAERIARSLVGTEDGPFLLYRRRRFVSWLSDAIHQNRPYDAIVRDVIASTGLWTDSPGTNFLTATITDDRDRPDENTLTVRVCRSLLGVRLDCAQCHDHPFDPQWTRDDFASLAAFFASAEPSLAGIRDATVPPRCSNVGHPDAKVRSPRVPFGEQFLPADGAPRDRLARWITAPGNETFARAAVNRMWKLLFGRALVEPLDDLGPDGPFPKPLEILTDEFIDARFDLRHLIRTIVATEVFQRASTPTPETEDADGAEQWASYPLTRLRPEQIAGALIQASSLTTIDAESNILVRMARGRQQEAFLRRYGDRGFDELESAAGTLAQRLLLLNGDLVHEKTGDDLFHSACARIAAVAPTDAAAVDTAFLCVLSRRPSPRESRHFQKRLQAAEPSQSVHVVSDLYWAMINSTEFCWNH